MGLDIRFTQQKERVCPHCGKELADPIVIDTEDSCGRLWYPFLESIGYYVPFKERTEENYWCGRDMVLTKEQAEDAYKFVKKNGVYNGHAILVLISAAVMEGDDLVVNADW